MIKIVLHTQINAPREVCFNASRNIDLHASSMSHTSEKAIAGTTTGLINLGESVTWRARHFGVTMYLTTMITHMEFPNTFTDEMKKGPFKFMHHVHQFENSSNGTVMTDIFRFQSPFGILGKLVDSLILKRYMTSLLLKRNHEIKRYVETFDTIYSHSP